MLRRSKTKVEFVHDAPKSLPRWSGRYTYSLASPGLGIFEQG